MTPGGEVVSRMAHNHEAAGAIPAPATFWLPLPGFVRVRLVCDTLEEMNTLPCPRPLVVVIIDGWGWRTDEVGNAVAAARTPTMDRLLRHFPSAAITASGLEVGLPPGVAGNSEVGHRNIGAGRVEYQLMTSIDRAIESGAFFNNHVLTSAITHVQARRSALHLMGLLSRGNVHASLNHLLALLNFISRYGGVRERVFVHVFTDGRDSPPRSARRYLQELEDAIGKYGVGRIASVTGRFYAMDRNANWERTTAAYRMLTGGKRGPGAPTPERALTQAYAHNLHDELVPPTALTRGGAPIATIRAGDAVVFFNFRSDRARQLTAAFTNPEAVPFATRELADLYFVTFADYDPRLAARAAFAGETASHPLARAIADAQLRQLHIAETEKYAHITYFLNVGHEEPFAGEKHVLIRSASAMTFTQQPAMASHEITREVLTALTQDQYEVYFINYANPDMVGHTGNFAATVEACEVVDNCVGQLLTAVLAKDGALVVTSDHGKAEQVSATSRAEEQPAHTTNPVPFHLARRQLEATTPKSATTTTALLTAPVGVLADVAPTILDILHVPKPEQMTGVSLLGSLR